MLSRVAESLYWLARNVERAETLARVLDVNYNRTMDRFSSRVDRALALWQGVTELAGMSVDLSLFDASDIAHQAFEYCTFSTESRTSIFSCVRIARTNASSVRAELSTEVWESINSLYLFVEAQSPRSIAREGPSSFLRTVRDTAQAFGGVIDATMTHDEEWNFLQLGRFLERAAMTARVVRQQNVDEDSEREWQRLLEMCCASEPFAKAQQFSSEPLEILSFLLLHQRFPRSVCFCTHETEAALHRISGSAPSTYANEAERIVGRLQAMLDFVQIEEIAGEGVAHFARRVGERLDAVGGAIEAAYFPRVPLLAPA